MSKNTRKNIHHPYIKVISLTFPYQTPMGKWTDWLRQSQESMDLGYQKMKTHISSKLQAILGFCRILVGSSFSTVLPTFS